MTRKKRKKLRGTVQKVIKGVANEPEKAEIGVEEADELYREIRVENVFSSEDGEKAQLREGTKVDIVVEADSDPTQKKPE